MAKGGQTSAGGEGGEVLGSGSKKLPKSRARRKTMGERLAAGGLAWLLLIAIITLLTVVIRQQMKISENLKSEDEKKEEIEERAQIQVHRQSNIEFDIKPEEAFVLDDLLFVPTDALPENGQGEFNSHWVREAGIHLVKAEGAYRDNRLSGAIEHYRAAQRIFPELKEINKFIGLIQVQQRDYSAAIRSLGQAVDDGFKEPEVYNNLGVAHLAGDNFDGAEVHLRKALELDEEYPLARYNLASLKYKSGDFSEATEEYERYLANRPRHIDAVQAYADCLIELGEWERASVQLRQVAGEKPDLAAPHFVLAQTLSMSGEYSEAMDILKHAITLVGTKIGLAWMARQEFDKFREQEEFTLLFNQLAEEDKQ